MSLILIYHSITKKAKKQCIQDKESSNIIFNIFYIKPTF